MARTTIKIKYTDPKQANQTIERVLSSHNYNYICENGENVWKCGLGFWTAMKYIKIEFSDNNTLLVSGWIRAVAGSEQDLNGFAGGLPKRQVMNVIQEIQQFMQQKISSLAASNELQSSGNSFPKAVKRLFISPLFIIFLVTVYNFLSLVVFSFFLEIKYISIPFTDILNTLADAGAWGRLGLVNMLAALVVAILVFAGFTVILINIAANLYGTGCKVGFYLIKISKFLQNILTLFSVALAAFKLVGDISGMFSSSSLTGYLTVAIILVLLTAGYIVFFSFKSLITVSVMKEAICTATPITKQYLFTAIGYFILADLAFGIQLFTGFNLTYTVGCVCAVLFGIYCIAFRNTMRRMIVKD